MSHILGDDFMSASICSSENLEGARSCFLPSLVSPQFPHPQITLCMEWGMVHSPKQSLEVLPHLAPSSSSNPPKARPVALGLPSPVRPSWRLGGDRELCLPLNAKDHVPEAAASE